MIKGQFNVGTSITKASDFSESLVIAQGGGTVLMWDLQNQDRFVFLSCISVRKQEHKKAEHRQHPNPNPDIFI